ncbi:MAG: hypothetical protein ACK5XZ_14375 [Hyphomonadaceae bacterium]|jgi:hypothetical protein|uniref:hypothetical protein n=1 Tax=Aquidulcibacter sp. TaxID=2052990 RepID=UPI0022C01C9F|nr:hypothetical protein [Aquidulcibacter sp.]MCZ8207232.1 hypothetical protein [Aquidulcibacter sp.]
MSDKHPGPQKILFWTDKRPLAPDVETRITCAIAEARADASLSALVLILIGLPYFVNENSNVAFFSNPIYPLATVAVIVIYLLGAVVVASQNLPKSNGQNLSFRSGIPESRTRLSRLLFWVWMILAFSYLGALIAHSLGSVWPKPLINNQVMVMAMGIAVPVLYSARRVQELLLWVLDLRAQQGHAIPFEAHLMAGPMTVENDWWKKPTP